MGRIGPNLLRSQGKLSAGTRSSIIAPTSQRAPKGCWRIQRSRHGSVRSRAWKLSQSNGSSVSPPLRSYMILAKPIGNSSSARVVISRKPSSSLEGRRSGVKLGSMRSTFLACQPTFFWLSRSLITANRLIPFWHAYLGLLQLADWTGSDEALDAFPYSEVSDGPRLLFARERARSLLARIGFDAAPLRDALPSDLSFDAVSSHPPTDIQLATAEAPGPVVVLEAETGSGKTEAALWRFAALLAAGKVEGLYFALPTRVAASQIHARVQATLDRLFPEAKFEAVRALPGDAMAGTATVRRLPNFDAQWSDDPDEIVRRSRWAAEQPKRFLAAPIAIGTIDQALLGAVVVKHAQMRSFCLSRALLVVDEVHASDGYMERHFEVAHPMGRRCQKKRIR
jgi:hypothetical protein